ncbi:hypothetical protein GIB67_002550 [Kingdonia uniflora]|uniref:Zinc finger PMZ-type domain-containing protein n=1 Tax=Kingdonia uniflora TaxID=39325 RepID=A0A7J7N8R5_9MAGN|nr:hypothetical protein GIB67_002550 [Kingdonia uniflora]
MLTKVPHSIEPKPIIGQTEPSSELRFESEPEQVKDLVDFSFKSAAYTNDPYDLSKEFNIGDLYRDRIKLKNHIIAYAVVNKFNLEHILGNEYKIVNTDPVGLQYILGIPKETWSNPYIPMNTEWLTQIMLRARITEEAKNSQARLAPWATDYYGTCSCRWWQTMGIPYEHGVRAFGLANVDPTTRISEYFTNDTYKAIYEPIWIPIRGIEQ